MNKSCAVMAIVALATLVGCTSESPKPTEKPQPKPAEIVTGRYAFQKMYIAARGWARDAQPFRLESQVTSDANGEDGKSAVWRASFASELQRGVKPYTWSGTDAADAPARGISPGPEDTYSPNNSSTQIFNLGFLKLDSDQALEVAQKHGGDKFLEKNKNAPVYYVLDWSRPTNELIWHVLYGGKDDAKLKIDVNASSGEFIRVEK
jgi:hypothetical protein